MTDEQRSLANRAWVPFGGGARSCIGFALAQIELTIIIARMAQRLDLHPDIHGDPTAHRPRREPPPRRSPDARRHPPGGTEHTGDVVSPEIVSTLTRRTMTGISDPARRANALRYPLSVSHPTSEGNYTGR